MIKFSFCDIHNNQGLSKCYQQPLPQPWFFWISQKPYPTIIVYKQDSKHFSEEQEEKKAKINRSVKWSNNTCFIPQKWAQNKNNIYVFLWVAFFRLVIGFFLCLLEKSACLLFYLS